MNEPDLVVDEPSASSGQLPDEGRHPRVDPNGVTFRYRGEADSVGLRCWIHGLPASQPFERIEGTDDWVLRIDLPPNSRIEYKFEIVRDGRVAWITDPANPLQASDPFGANSVVQGFGYVRPDWTLPDPGARAGQIEELEIPTALPGGVRRIGVYVPARFRRSRRYPLAGRARRHGLPALRKPAGRPRQPDPPTRDSIAHRGADRFHESPDRVRRTRRPRAIRANRAADCAREPLPAARRAGRRAD